jgi:hypothetical protein
MSRIVSQLAARLELLSSSLLELIVVGPHRPVSLFRREPLVNGIYVVHAPHGAILLSGLILETDSVATQSERADRIDALGTAGFASTYRVVDLGTADLARQLGRIVFDLFSGAFPLSQDQTAQTSTDAESAARAAEVPEAAPQFRKRGRPRKEESVAPASEDTLPPVARKRGRPPKNPFAAPVAAASTTDGAAVPADLATLEPAAVDDASGTINSDAPVATLVDSKDESHAKNDAVANGVDGADASDPTATGDGDDTSGGPMLQMTKNQRREKRRRELALLLKNGES